MFFHQVFNTSDLLSVERVAMRPITYGILMHNLYAFLADLEYQIE
jgi:hypothetical protein